MRRSSAFAYAAGLRSPWKKRRTSICKMNEYAPRKPNFSTSQKPAGALAKRGLQSTAVQHTANAAVVRKTGNRASILTRPFAVATARHRLAVVGIELLL